MLWSTQSLLRSQWSRNRCFSGILLLSLWSNECWQFNLWFLCLFWIQLVYLKVLGSHTAEAWVEGFWALSSSMWNECSYTVVWTLFSIVLPCDWNENWPFPVLWPLLSFLNLLTYWVQHEIKRHFLLGRKAMTNLDNILKSRDITLPTKVRLSQAMVSPVVMYGCESWTIKKAWVPKNWCFWTVAWRRLLRVPWTEKRWKQSILKEINPEYSLEGLILKLKL